MIPDSVETALRWISQVGKLDASMFSEKDKVKVTLFGLVVLVCHLSSAIGTPLGFCGVVNNQLRRSSKADPKPVPKEWPQKRKCKETKRPRKLRDRRILAFQFQACLSSSLDSLDCVCV